MPYAPNFVSNVLIPLEIVVPYDKLGLGLCTGSCRKAGPKVRSTSARVALKGAAGSVAGRRWGRRWGRRCRWWCQLRQLRQQRQGAITGAVAGPGHAQVARGGAEVGVAEQLADAVQIDTGLQQMGCEAMAPIPSAE